MSDPMSMEQIVSLIDATTGIGWVRRPDLCKAYVGGVNVPGIGVAFHNANSPTYDIVECLQLGTSSADIFRVTTSDGVDNYEFLIVNGVAIANSESLPAHLYCPGYLDVVPGGMNSKLVFVSGSAWGSVTIEVFYAQALNDLELVVSILYNTGDDCFESLVNTFVGLDDGTATFSYYGGSSVSPEDPRYVSADATPIAVSHTWIAGERDFGLTFRMKDGTLRQITFHPPAAGNYVLPMESDDYLFMVQTDTVPPTVTPGEIPPVPEDTPVSEGYMRWDVFSWEAGSIGCFKEWFPFLDVLMSGTSPAIAGTWVSMEVQPLIPTLMGRVCAVLSKGLLGFQRYASQPFDWIPGSIVRLKLGRAKVKFSEAAHAAYDSSTHEPYSCGSGDTILLEPGRNLSVQWIADGPVITYPALGPAGYAELSANSTLWEAPIAATSPIVSTPEIPDYGDVPEPTTGLPDHPDEMRLNVFSWESAPLALIWETAPFVNQIVSGLESTTAGQWTASSVKRAVGQPFTADDRIAVAQGAGLFSTERYQSSYVAWQAGGSANLRVGRAKLVFTEAPYAAYDGDGVICHPEIGDAVLYPPDRTISVIWTEGAQPSVYPALGQAGYAEIDSATPKNLWGAPVEPDKPKPTAPTLEEIWQWLVDNKTYIGYGFIAILALGILSQIRSFLK